MNLNFKNVLLILIAPLLICGCSTTSALFDRSNASAERMTRFAEMAQHYEQIGNTQAAMRIYEHMLIQQPDHPLAKDRHSLLAQRESTAQMYAQNALRTGPGSALNDQDGSDSVLPTPAAKLPATKLAAVSDRNLAQELQLAEKMRPVGTTVTAESLFVAPSGEAPTGETQASSPLLPTRVASFKTELPSRTASTVEVSPVAVAHVQQNSIPHAQVQNETPDSAFRKPLHAAVDVRDDWKPTSSRSVKTSEIPLQESGIVNVRASSQPVLALVGLCEDLPAELQTIVARMESPRAEERIASLVELSRMASSGKPASVAVYALLEDRNELVRVYAAGTLRDISNDSWSSVQTLSRSLNSQNDEVVCLAAYMLGQMNSEAMDALDALTMVREKRQGICSLYAAEAVSKIAPGDPRSIDFLISKLENGDRQTRWMSVLMLGNVNVESERKAAGALRKAILDSDSEISSMACLSLAGLGDYGRLAAVELRQTACSDNLDVKVSAEIALFCLGIEGPSTTETSVTQF